MEKLRTSLYLWIKFMTIDLKLPQSMIGKHQSFELGYAIQILDISSAYCLRMLRYPYVVLMTWLCGWRSIANQNLKTNGGGHQQCGNVVDRGQCRWTLCLSATTHFIDAPPHPSHTLLTTFPHAAPYVFDPPSGRVNQWLEIFPNWDLQAQKRCNVR